MSRASSGRKPSRAPARNAPGKSVRETPTAAPGLEDYEVHRAGSALRAQLHRVEARIGMLAEPDPMGPGNRFRGATLLPATADVPAAFIALFPGELAELERLGKSPARCHATDLAPYRVYCLPYFTFDGFNALLAVEQAGDFVAAWQDRESQPAHYPREVRLRGGAAALERFLARALRPAR